MVRKRLVIASVILLGLLALNARTLIDLTSQVKGILPVANLPFTYTGNTSELATATGTFTSGNCVKTDVNHNVVDGGPCASGSGTVTTTGSPASGNLAKFSGATSITNGDLSGDGTTSGTLALTIGNLSHVTNNSLASSGMTTTGVTAGSYTNTNLTVDAEGRLTAASNGSGTGLSLGFYKTPWPGSSTAGVSPANTITLTPFVLPGNMSITKVGLVIITASGAVTGDFGIYNSSGTLLASVGGFTLGTPGAQEQTLAGGPISLSAGTYYAAWAQTDTSGRIGLWNVTNFIVPLSTATSTTTATAGVLPGSIVIPAAGVSVNIQAAKAFTLR